jgi:predicted acyltransferase
VLSTIPAVATTIVGLLFGQVLLNAAPAGAKLKTFGLTGLGCLAAGFALSPVVPIVMKLWTTTYALVVTGWASLFFALFYWVIDVRGWRRWTFPFAVIGVNALAAYLLHTIIPISRITGTFTKPLAPSLGGFGPVLTSGAVFLVAWLILFWLNRRKIYLRP